MAPFAPENGSDDARLRLGVSLENAMNHMGRDKGDVSQVQQHGVRGGRDGPERPGDGGRQTPLRTGIEGDRDRQIHEQLFDFAGTGAQDNHHLREGGAEERFQGLDSGHD